MDSLDSDTCHIFKDFLTKKGILFVAHFTHNFGVPRKNCIALNFDFFLNGNCIEKLSFE